MSILVDADDRMRIPFGIASSEKWMHTELFDSPDELGPFGVLSLWHLLFRLLSSVCALRKQDEIFFAVFHRFLKLHEPPLEYWPFEVR